MPDLIHVHEHRFLLPPPKLAANMLFLTVAHSAYSLFVRIAFLSQFMSCCGLFAELLSLRARVVKIRTPAGAPVSLDTKMPAMANLTKNQSRLTAAGDETLTPTHPHTRTHQTRARSNSDGFERVSRAFALAPSHSPEPHTRKTRHEATSSHLLRTR